jgi:hypothetical protein
MRMQSNVPKNEEGDNICTNINSFVVLHSNKYLTLNKLYGDTY